MRNDPRYAFMFDNANVGGDTMAEVLSQLFRMPANGKPMTIMQLAGFPSEVVDAVMSVLCRMAFDFGLWSDGAIQLLFVCEEAHRYASVDRNIGFGPTRRAISRIAKEGRKYGVFLGLVTQRPAELDPTIISQCSTLFAMRLSNDRDQALVRSAVSDAAASLLAFLPSLGDARGVRVRRRRGAADAAEVQGAARPSAPEGRDGSASRRRRRRRVAGIHRHGDRALARRDHEPQRPDGRSSRNAARSPSRRPLQAGGALTPTGSAS